MDFIQLTMLDAVRFITFAMQATRTRQYWLYFYFMKSSLNCFYYFNYVYVLFISIELPFKWGIRSNISEMRTT